MKKIILGLMMCVASVGAFAQQQQKVVIGGKPYIVNISKDGEMTATPIEGNANPGPVQKKTALYGNTGTYIEGPNNTYENGLPVAEVGGHPIIGHDLTKASRSYVDNYQTKIDLNQAFDLFLKAIAVLIAFFFIMFLSFPLIDKIAIILQEKKEGLR